MADYKDINAPPRNKNNAPLVIAGIILLALILGFMFMRNDNNDDISRTAPAADDISSGAPIAPSSSE